MYILSIYPFLPPVFTFWVWKLNVACKFSCWWLRTVLYFGLGCTIVLFCLLSFPFFYRICNIYFELIFDQNKNVSTCKFLTFSVVDCAPPWRGRPPRRLPPPHHHRRHPNFNYNIIFVLFYAGLGSRSRLKKKRGAGSSGLREDKKHKEIVL